MKVATYSATGIFAGRVVELRKVQGAQRWRVRVAVAKPDGEQIEHVVEPSDRVPLGALTDIVMASIAEICQPGELLTAARMDFYIR